MAFIKLNFNADVNRCLSGLKATLQLGRPKSGIKKLEKEMEKLRAKRDDIRKQIVEAESEGKILTNEVSQWLLEVGILEGKVADIEHDFQNMSCFSCNNCFNQTGGTSSQTQEAGDQVLIRESSNYCSINRRAMEKLGEANELMSRTDALDPIATDLSRPESGIHTLEKEMTRLRAKRDDIKNQIGEAEREGKIPTNEVNQWLREVKILEGKVADIEQDFNRTAGTSSNRTEAFAANLEDVENVAIQTQQAGDDVPITESSNCYSRQPVGIESYVKDIVGYIDCGEGNIKANKLMSRAGALDLTVRVQHPEPTVMLSISNRPPVGIESYVKDIVGYIDGGEGNIKVNKLMSRAGALDLTATIQHREPTVMLPISNRPPVGIESYVKDIVGYIDGGEGNIKANKLMRRAGTLDPIVTVGPPEPTVMLPISHRPPVGSESYVEDIVGYVDGGEGNIIGIYGMGGVGKTTILNRIQQHYLPKHTTFDRVIWVVASKDCQLKKLQMDIAKSLGLETLQENDDEKACGDKLFSYLMNKKCLMFVDDIWEHLNLQLLGMAHSATEQGQQQQQQPRKVVVFTTRSETVCAQMKAEKKMKVNCLDSDQAWQLFVQNSDGDVLSSDAGIKFVAEELTKECAGLPLALVTVARAMSGKRSWETWKEALHQIRDKHEWATIGLSEDSLVMYKAFKLSYDSLENDSVRECLLCCALWPEDYEIKQFFELIPCWIGCGIIREFNVINEAFAKGYSHLESLVAASLLEQCCRMDFSYEDTFVKMHDVIRDMALLMVSGLKGNKRKWIVKAGIGLSDLPRQEEWQEAERASFMYNNITSLPEYEANSTFPKLSMLILHWNRNLKTLPPSLFPSMPHLTYLDLSGCRITELPREMCSLTELQYLNLSNNSITRLPIEFGCLSKLEYLLLSYNRLEIVPNGMISNLSMLKWLDISGIYLATEWWWDELKCFKGRHQLSVTIDIKATTDDIERLNMLPANISIWELTLDGKNISKLPNCDMGTPQWGCRVSDNLEILFMLHLRLDRLELAVALGRESSFGCLKFLYLFNLELLEEISLNRVRLYNLREISIVECPMLKDVSWVLQLSCLNFLQIMYCGQMKEVISEAGNSNSISSSSCSCSIKRLSLSHMSNLNRIANRPLHFPYLEYIRVLGCPELKKLPFGVEISKNRLKVIEGKDDWWNNLDWDDESIKDSLTPYFRSC